MPSKTITLDGESIMLRPERGGSRLGLYNGRYPEEPLPHLTKEQALIAAAVLRNWARGVDLELCKEGA